VRRFLVGWWLLILIATGGLISQFQVMNRLAQQAVAESGGVYSEAAIGTVRGINPILPESTLSQDISRLLFSGLTRYNAQGRIIPDLANWDVSADGRTYTFHLRDGVKWHDGQSLTAADVEFTITAIQNPDSHSPLASSWQGVTCETPDDKTVVFKIPQPLTSFLDSTTVGILPRHILESVEPTSLREAAFGQEPVGTGPFKMKTFAPSAHTIELAANQDYYFGQPRLDGFEFKLYDTAEAALEAFAARQVASPGRLTPSNIDSRYLADDQLKISSFTLPEEAVLFFDNADPVLADKRLRQALSRYLDRDKIAEAATKSYGQPLTQPLLPGQIGYTNKYQYAPLDAAGAAAELASAGWGLPAGETVRYKDNKPLVLKLATTSGGELEAAAKEIKEQLAGIGVSVELALVSRDDLQQSYIRPRSFQMLLYNINLGSDPDVYSFWHSSQISDPGLNVSQYKSIEADRSLETARLKADDLIRKGKYETFLRQWNADAPAAVLYQRVYVYGQRSTVAGLAAKRLVTPADRFYQIERWTVNQRFVSR
jgi:peptide/nickel transport system substrate-binding protein